MRRVKSSGALFVAALCLTPAYADLTISGHSGIEVRTFFQPPILSEQMSDVHFSTFGELELEYEFDQGELKFIGFGRADSKDGERTHVDIREAHWSNSYGDFEVLIGINKIFWGVTESRHLVNTINTIDAVEALDGEDSLGQPMVNITWNSDIGEFGLFVLPEHRPQPFAGVEGRFRILPLAIKDDALYAGDASDDYVSAALRYSHYIGDWDLGLHYFHGINREPTTFEPNGDVTVIPNVAIIPNSLTPVYDLINQAGIDAQLTLDAWLYKFEALWREGQGDTFAAATGGFEYSFYQVLDTDKDLGVLVEYSYDDREPNAFMNNDAFLGARLAWNDMNDTALLAGMVHDLDDGTSSIRLEAERRVGESFTLELEAQVFTNVDAENPLFTIRNDDYISLSLINYF